MLLQAPIALISAFPGELFPTTQQDFKQHSESLFLGVLYQKGELWGREVVLIVCNMGREKAAAATLYAIKELNCQTVINLGTAGTIDPQLDTGDIVVSNRVILHDDIKPKLKKHLSKNPQSYRVAENNPFHPIQERIEQHFPNMEFPLDKAAQHKLKRNQGKIIPGTFLSVGKPVLSSRKSKSLKEQYPEALAVEMESGGIAYTAQAFNKSWLVLRTITDFADEKVLLSFKSVYKTVTPLLKPVVQSLFY